MNLQTNTEQLGKDNEVMQIVVVEKVVVVAVLHVLGLF